ncbi:Outer envelope pore protein 16-3, chloroplastic/mitochondrial [Glycine soja]|uniref:Outer envelope pore protein 16-3, chloroplastic/mitochondrial n=1 Tax=Glycine soja TaxID=3848 RepID=A0A445FGF9_GLYSO|nr:Outer envelope pore protein 16-3, chloroplastic/mitochondrial [Glycine soja]
MDQRDVGNTRHMIALSLVYKFAWVRKTSRCSSGSMVSSYLSWLSGFQLKVSVVVVGGGLKPLKGVSRLRLDCVLTIGEKKRLRGMFYCGPTVDTKCTYQNLEQSHVMVDVDKCAEKIMVDAAERRYLEDDDSSLMKTIKGATTGLVAGTIWGTVVATWYDVPRVERNVALPGLIRTFKMMGNYGLTFAAIGGVYIGVEQLVQNYRMKRDLVNGAVGGFVAGATILGYRGKPIYHWLLLWLARIDLLVVV